MTKENPTNTEATEFLSRDQSEGAAPETRMMQLFRHHEAIHRAMNDKPSRRTDEELYTFHVQLMKVEAEIAATPSGTMADFAAKAVALTSRGNHSPYWETSPLWHEARRLIGTELGVPPETMV